MYVGLYKLRTLQTDQVKLFFNLRVVSQMFGIE